MKNATDNLFSNNMHQGKLSKKDLYHIPFKISNVWVIFQFWHFIKTDWWSLYGFAFRTKLSLDNCPPDLKPVVYRSYFGNIFVLLKSKDHWLLFAKYMNTRHKNLKFPFDFEQNNSLSFLDVKNTCRSKALLQINITVLLVTMNGKIKTTTQIK